MIVVARETSIIPCGQEAIILGKTDLENPILLKKQGILKPPEAFCDKQIVLAFNTFSEFQEDAIPARVTNQREDRTIYKGSALGTITILEADTLAQNSVALEQKQKYC